MTHKAKPRNSANPVVKKSNIKSALKNRAQIKASVTATRVTATRKTAGTQHSTTLNDILFADLFS